jgi:hypothetical protein
MILAMAVMLFQLPGATAGVNAPRPLLERPAVESSAPALANAPEGGSENTSAASAAEIAPVPPMPASTPESQPVALPIVEPPTTFLSAGIYNPPPPYLLDFEPAPVMHPKAWFLLGAVEHSSATYDAWSTRRALESGRVEADPVMRPFAGSPAIYGAIQAIPIGLDYLARRLQRSSGWTRHIWWAPQSLATATFLFSGSYNVSHTN